MASRLKVLWPRGLYGRAALILVVPVVTIQLVVSTAFIQRHYDDVTRQMTEGVAAEVALLLQRPDAAAMADALGIVLQRPATGPAPQDGAVWWDFSAPVVITTLRDRLPQVTGVDIASDRRLVRLRVGDADFTIDRRRVSASNPHQLLVLMVVTSILMTLVAGIFLRNQLRPVARLARAAEAFGRGQSVPYKPRGAAEIRAAGMAFLDMRSRIERQIEQRTMMLSAVSHDLRTPLTRMRLGLAMLPQDDDTAALTRDLAEMERMVDDYLAFARGDATEDAVPTDPVALAAQAVADARRAGHAVRIGQTDGRGDVALRPQAIRRALDNLIGNAVRHGTQGVVDVVLTDRALRLSVGDDGPGIPADRRDEALQPFARLDLARDPNRGGGAGLGLAIATDVARSHGGTLRLGDSPLGGLQADLVIPR
jgi:two-component system, OmpR family, osmolarity sensor histidine kinase EnvZ